VDSANVQDNSLRLADTTVVNADLLFGGGGAVALGTTVFR